MNLVGPLSSGVAVGSAGAATNNFITDYPVKGEIKAVYVDYLDSPPGTTDVTIETAGEAHPAMPILSLADANTDGWFYPRVDTVQPDGTAWAGEVPFEIPIHDKIKITIDDADAGDYVHVWLLLE